MSERIKALALKMQGLINQAKALQKEWEGKEEPIPEELSTKIDGLLGQADEIKAQIVTEQRLVEGTAFLQEGLGPEAAFHGFRESGPVEGLEVVDHKAWREVESHDALGRAITVRYFVPIAVEAKGYRSAFEAYLRKDATQIGPKDRKVLSEGIDSAGGHLVPEDFHAELIKKQATMVTIRPNARVIQTSRDVAKWPRVVYDTDDEWTSGVRLTWTGEVPSSSTVHRVTEPVFGMTNIPVHTAMASLPLSNDLLEDAAFDVFGIGAELFAEAFALGEEYSFINGDGVAQPMGLITKIGAANGIATGAAVTTAGTIDADAILDNYWAVPAQYRPRAGWWFNSGTAALVDKLKDGQARYIMSSLMSGSLASPQVDVIKGKPVHYAEFMPDEASGAYPMIFGDMTGYFIVDRVGLSVQRFTDSRWAEQNASLLLGRKRVGGSLVAPWKLRALQG